MNRFGGSIFQNVNSKVPDRILSFGHLPDFINFLKECHKRHIPSKETNQLLSPSWFEGRRGADFVVSSSGLWFDQDCKGGFFSVDEFSALFPQIKFTAFNTYSTTRELPKSRYYVPTNGLMTADEYDDMIDCIWEKIARKKPNHGFDKAPSSAASLFFLPCQAPSGYSFFVEHGQNLLDVDKCLKEYREQRKWIDYYSNRPRIFQKREERQELSLVDAERLLQRIPSDGREIWFSVACALKHSFGDIAFQVWDRWSRGTTSNNYDSRDQKRTWKSIKPLRRKQMTIATIIWLEKQYREGA
jgi:hypothetical protein